MKKPSWNASEMLLIKFWKERKQFSKQELEKPWWSFCCYTFIFSARFFGNPGFWILSWIDSLPDERDGEPPVMNPWTLGSLWVIRLPAVSVVGLRKGFPETTELNGHLYFWGNILFWCTRNYIHCLIVDVVKCWKFMLIQLSCYNLTLCPSYSWWCPTQLITPPCKYRLIWSSVHLPYRWVTASLPASTATLSPW